MSEGTPDLSALISSLMQDPAALEKLRTLAGAFLSGGSPAPRDESNTAAQVSETAEETVSTAAVPQTPPSPALKGLSLPLSRNRLHRQCSLLRALRPYLSERRAEAIDTFVRTEEVLSLLGSDQDERR